MTSLWRCDHCETIVRDREDVVPLEGVPGPETETWHLCMDCYEGIFTLPGEVDE